jgi:hypothetical protein
MAFEPRVFSPKEVSMPPTPVTKDQFLDFLAQKFRGRAKAFLQANLNPDGSWIESAVQTLFDTLNGVPGSADPPTAACPNGGDVPGTCQYVIGTQKFSAHMTCSQCEGLNGQFTPDPSAGASGTGSTSSPKV